MNMASQLIHLGSALAVFSTGGYRIFQGLVIGLARTKGHFQGLLQFEKIPHRIGNSKQLLDEVFLISETLIILYIAKTESSNLLYIEKKGSHVWININIWATAHLPLP